MSGVAQATRRGGPLARPGRTGPAWGWMRPAGVTVPPIAAWAVAGVYFIGISRFHQYVPILALIQTPTILSLTALGVFFSSTESWQPGDLTRNWLTKSVLTIAIIAAVGAPFALYPGRAVAFLNEAYSRTILLWLVGWGLARTRAGAHMLARAVAVGGIATAVMAVVEGRTDRDGRLSGAFMYDPNDLALICVVTLPLVFWWLIDPRAKASRWAVLPAVPLLVFVIVESGSRGAFLGLVAVLLGTASLLFGRIPRRVKSVAKWILVGGIAVAPFLPADYVARVKTIGSEEDYNQNSETGRMKVWKRGIGYGLDHPLLGVGISNFNTAEGWLAEQAALQNQGIGWKWSTAHNSFVQLFAELGVIAGVLFPYLFIRSFIELRRWHKKRPQSEPEDLLPPLLAVMVLAFIVNGMFLSFAYYDIVYAMLALVGGVLHPLRRKVPFVQAGPAVGGRTGMRRSAGAVTAG